MRSPSAALAVLAVMLSGCMPPTSSSDFDAGPAGTSGSAAASEQDRIEKPKKKHRKEPDAVMLGDRIVFDDGVRVDVTKIGHGKLTQLDTEIFDSEAEAGASYVDFTVRIVNKSKQSLALSTSDLVTYGPDEDEAEEVLFAEADADITATLKPSKSRSLRLQYVIPKKHQRNVRMEFHFEEGRDPAIFEGSVR